MNRKEAQKLRENVIRANKKTNKKSKQKRLTPSQLKNKYFTKTEEQEQADLCRWMKQQYPEILYTIDLAGIGLTPAQRKIHSQRVKRGHPDIIIQEWCQDYFCGLAIEFKRKNKKINHFEISKKTKEGKHLREQYQYLMDLRKRDYLAVFVSGFENAKIVIDLYMNGTLSNLKQINNYVFPQVDFKKITR